MKRIEAYYNLHKRCLSYRESGGKVNHASVVIISDATFSVQPAGREKVRREKRKNVHAYVRGLPAYIRPHFIPSAYDVEVEGSALECLADHRKITYNPYKYESFVYADTEEPVDSADWVLAIGRNIFEIPPLPLEMSST
jgi:hypothetical protein